VKKVFYECQRCGNCCRWPGTVLLGEGEAQRIANYLHLGVDAFINQYTTISPNRQGLTLVSRANHECIFLEGRNTCMIQEVKPKQCERFPNEWNFPGWEKVCEAIPVEQLE
jgi:Fe-S-cluster containining protein